MTIFLLLCLALAMLWFYRAWVVPARELKAEIQRLAGGDTRAGVVRMPNRFYRVQFLSLGQIAERVQAVGKQAEQEGFSLRAVLGSMVEGLVIADRDLRIQMENGALAEMFALHRKAAGRTVLETFGDAGLQEAMRTALETGDPVQAAFVVDGDVGKRYFEVNTVAFRPDPDGQSAAVLAVFRDVTAAKEMESARRDLVVNVSHELRTPLSIIKGYVETLLDGAVEDPALAAKFLRIMHKHGERLDLLIDDLLSLSRLESGSARLFLEPVDLRRCAEVVIERLEPRIRAHGVEIGLGFPPGLPEVVADVHRLDQVLTNLLDNALKYTAPGQAKITVSAELRGADVRVCVRDNGPGIPSEDLPKIFERFYRVEKDRSRSAGGSGLGLSLVEKIIRMHGGIVGVESTPGAGSDFWFQIPVAGPEPAAG